ncbi:hypothetical protein [Promicromonospora panici]|uniref:hypothetical protein n=1 Tax=Promicromonospora panici TaxID=2219658 RepID=UPI00101C6E13|nr:hypothetical protein [Promicromonospora panici]
MSATIDLDESGRLAHRRTMLAMEKRFGGGLLLTGVWYWTSIIFASIVIAVLQSRFSVLEGGTLQYVLGSTRWFLFTMGMILVAVTLPLHLASGGTRSSFVAGLFRSALYVGLANGIMAAALVTAEGLTWNALGWDWQFRQGLVPGGSFIVDAASETLVLATYILIGTLLPAGFQRLGAWGGSFWILALLAIALFVDWSVHSGYIFGWDPLVGAGTARTLLGLGGGVLAVAVTAFAVDRFYRDMPLRPALG